MAYAIISLICEGRETIVRRLVGKISVASLGGAFLLLWLVSALTRRWAPLPDPDALPVPAQPDPIGVVGWVLVGLGILGVLAWVIAGSRSRLWVRRTAPRRRKPVVRAPQVFLRTVVYSGSRSARPIVRRQYYR